MSASSSNSSLVPTWTSLLIKTILSKELHLGSIYLITRDFEKSIAFYEKLLSMTVSTRNCGNKFAEFFFDNKCLALMNESNLRCCHGQQCTAGMRKEGCPMPEKQLQVHLLPDTECVAQTPL